MDCVTFRRRLLEDPMRNDADFLEHEQACSGCADYARRVRASEITMPDETLSEPMNVGDTRFAGYIQPTAWGSIAVVGEAGEHLSGPAGRLLRSVIWPATVPKTARTRDERAVGAV